MHLKLFDIEINLQIITRRGRVVEDLKTIGFSKSVVNYQKHYKCKLFEAYTYVKTIEAEEIG